MDLAELGRDIDNEIRDIKNRPKVYFYRIVATIFWALSWFVIISPCLGFVDNWLLKSGAVGLLGLVLITILKVTLPEGIHSIFSADIMKDIDTAEDLKKVAIFYIIAFLCFCIVKYAYKFFTSINYAGKQPTTNL